ncbi:MAG: RNA polymerase sigma factor SigZ [Phycisphaerae bacterium]|jgi:RNA polymerase sigma-70 factor (ECF subfamily)|nr:RNA polymerase sigma factor SigZ [Phycisphaerae bacterium]
MIGSVAGIEMREADMERSAETERLWGALHDALLAYIRRRVETLDDAEDILQDVFVRIHANLGKLDNVQSVTAWVYRIARNAITDYHRKTAANARTIDKMALGAVESSDAVDITDRATEEFSHCIEPLLGEVPQPYREAIELTELGGMTRKDAAAQLGLSVSGMKARVQRGRGKLKDALLDCCNMEFDHRGGLLDYDRRTDSNCDNCDCG